MTLADLLWGALTIISIAGVAVVVHETYTGERRRNDLDN